MVIEEPDKKQDFDEADDALLEPFKRVDGIFQNIAWREMKIDEKIYIAKEFMSRRDASGGKFKIDLFPSRYGWDTRTFEKLVADVGSEMKLNIALPYPFEPIGVGEDGYVRYRILRRGDRDYFVGQANGEDKYGKTFPKQFVSAIMEVYKAYNSLAFSIQQRTFLERYEIPKETWNGWCAKGNTAKANGPSLKRKSNGSSGSSSKRHSNAVPFSPTSPPSAQLSSSSSSSTKLVRKIDVLQQIIGDRPEKACDLEESLEMLFRYWQEAKRTRGPEKTQIAQCLNKFLEYFEGNVKTTSERLQDIYLKLVDDDMLQDQDGVIAKKSGQ